MKVYARIRSYIEQNGMDADTVAYKAGISPAVFKKMLDGRRTIYSEQYKAICQALGVGAETFLDIKLA